MKKIKNINKSFDGLIQEFFAKWEISGISFNKINKLFVSNYTATFNFLFYNSNQFFQKLKNNSNSNKEFVDKVVELTILNTNFSYLLGNSLNLFFSYLKFELLNNLDKNYNVTSNSINSLLSTKIINQIHVNDCLKFEYSFNSRLVFQFLNRSSFVQLPIIINALNYYDLMQIYKFIFDNYQNAECKAIIKNIFKKMNFTNNQFYLEQYIYLAFAYWLVTINEQTYCEIDNQNEINYLINPIAISNTKTNNWVKLDFNLGENNVLNKLICDSNYDACSLNKLNYLNFLITNLKWINFKIWQVYINWYQKFNLFAKN